MRLLKCYIENFGKIQKFTYEFQNGINVVNEQNGWGKTTFAAFIKAMFYGMESTAKRSLDENERKKYTPWQGGNYGGYLDFEIDDRTYRIERYFGARGNQNSFRLTNQKSKLESKDYSENVGEEIFKIDKAGYERSTYILQKDLQIDVNDSLSAKLSNLVEDSNDISNFNTAKSKLELSIKKLSTIGDKGEIPKTKNRINILSSKLIDISELEAKILRDKEKLSDLEEEKAIKIVLFNDIKNRYEKITEAAKDIANKNHYISICKSDLEKNIERENVEGFFLGQVPDEEDIKGRAEMAAELAGHHKILFSREVNSDKRNRFSDLQRRYVNDFPQDDEINEYISMAEDFSNKKIELQGMEDTYNNSKIGELEQFFQNEVPVDAKLVEIQTKCEETIIKSNDIRDLETRIKILEESKISGTYRNNSSTSIKSKTIIFVNLLLAFLTVAFFAIMPPLAVIGILALSVFNGFVLFAKNNQKNNQVNHAIPEKTMNIDELRLKLKTLQGEYKKLEEEIGSFLLRFPLKERTTYAGDVLLIKSKRDDYLNGSNSLKRTIENITTKREERRQLAIKINDFIAKYIGPVEESNYTDVLRTMKEDKVIYLNLNKEIVNYEEIKNKINETEPEIQAYLGKTVRAYHKNDDLQKTFNAINEKVSVYNRIKQELVKIKLDKEMFEKNNDTTKFTDMIEATEKVEDLKVQQNDISREVEELTKGITKLGGIISDDCQQADERFEIEAELVERKEEFEEYSKKYELLKKALDFLNDAKEDFDSRYLGGITTSFEEYLNLLNGVKIDNTSIDVNLDFQVEEYGIRREVKYLSQGYRDIVAICTRFALIDALFKEENPFVILDDPFVNLDDDKIVNALEILKQISKKYQIIYYVCHSSRVY